MELITKSVYPSKYFGIPTLLLDTGLSFTMTVSLLLLTYLSSV